MGVRFKSAAFSSFYDYTYLDNVANKTIDFEKVLSPDINKIQQYSVSYLNEYFLKRLNKQNYLSSVIEDVRMAKGQVSINELAK